jgi:hypothetical protein
VVQPRVARPHRILVAAERWQSLANEGGQGLQCLVARHRPGKAAQLTGVRRKARFDERDDLAREGVWFESHAIRHRAGTGGAEGLAVVRIEVPLAARRLAIGLHQHTVTQAKLAIEELQPQ